MLKREFGDEYYKYYYEEVDERTLSSNESMRNGYSIPISEDAFFQYYLSIKHKTNFWPWGAINEARTTFWGKSKHYDSNLNYYPETLVNIQMISVSLSDDVTPSKTVTEYGSSGVDVYGNWNVGFFGKGAGNFVSSHTAQDSRIPGGMLNRVW